MITSLKYALRLFPVARSYWRKHGLAATIARSVEVLFTKNREESVVSASEWLGNGSAEGGIRSTSPQVLKRMQVAIIGALDLPQCYKYRVAQKIEQLQNVHGIDVMISSFVDIPRAFDSMQLATAVIFYRVPYGQQFLAYAREAERLGINTVYDIDDPVFAQDVYEKNRNLETLSPSESRGLIAECSNYLEAMRCVDACITSTPKLAELARRELTVPVYLWRNALDAETLDIAERITSEDSSRGCADVPAKGRRVTIGYMSGSRAHDRDFELIAEPIARILEAHPETRLLLKGYAKLPHVLDSFGERIAREGFSGYHDYFRTMQSCDVIVVPLLADEFNGCKSAIRYLESSVVRKPCVMSRVGDVCNLAKAGETILFADSESDWFAHLESLVVSPERRTRLGMSAHASVKDTQSSAAIAAALPPDLLSSLRGRHDH